ncbi:MAG: hypothetical protein QXM75_02935 [Candidatus Diapherotrites archaeon]
MLELIIFALCLVCFTATYYLVGKIAEHNKKIGIRGIDINKAHKPALPESTGIALLFPLWLVAVSIFIIEKDTAFIAWAVMISGFSLVGYADDMKHKTTAKAIPWRIRAAIIGVISLLFSFIFFGNNLLLVVLAALYLAGIASFENTFAGLNGVEAGSGLIILVFVSLVVFSTTGKTIVFLAALPLIVSILAFLIYNKYPAKVFPGDSGTLLIGSAIAGLVIMQQSFPLMILTFLFFIPHMIDFALKMITNPKDPSQKKELPYVLNSDGTLDVPQSRKLDFAKMLLLIFGPKREPIVVAMMLTCVILNCAFWYVLFFIIV